MGSRFNSTSSIHQNLAVQNPSIHRSVQQLNALGEGVKAQFR
jgi:hypothetical protein